jgi:lipoyl-dependent peroxiredoxin
MIRSAEAIWSGNLKQGMGAINTESGAIKDLDYSFTKRFENEKGTNPEELIAAAHAACYSMDLAHNLSVAGFVVKGVKTTDKVHLNKTDDGFEIGKIVMHCEAEVIGIDNETFLGFAESSKKNCIVAKALGKVNFELHISLNHKVEA